MEVENCEVTTGMYMYVCDFFKKIKWKSITFLVFENTGLGRYFSTHFSALENHISKELS